MTRVIAPSRLHFGLFRVPPHGEHQPGERLFGGVGLMIDSPGVVVTAERGESWRFEGMLASRAQEFAMRFTQSLRWANRTPIHARWRVACGVGNALPLGFTVSTAAA
ncbi:MAG: hypothetical protein K8U57_01550 [Planctomycetes bacterium]|nr:hypothetical protein [Planctomycetota bacterium]